MSEATIIRPPSLTPDEIHTRFTALIETGRFPVEPSPARVYSWAGYIATIQESPYLTAYGSTAITTAGAGAPDREGNSLPFGEAMSRNLTYAGELLRVAVEDNPNILSPETTMNPGSLGKVFYYTRKLFASELHKGASWSQQDYLRVWFSHLCGIRQHEPEQGSLTPEDGWWLTDIRTERLFAAHHRLTEYLYPVMDDKARDESERLLAYRTFAESFADCARIMEKAGHISLNPVPYMIKLIGATEGHPRSLGVGSELHLGKYLGITPLELVLSGDQWGLKQLSHLYEDLTGRNAAFALPAGKVALALSTYEDHTPVPKVNPEPVRDYLDDPVANCLAASFENAKAHSAKATDGVIHEGIAQIMVDIDYNRVKRRPYNRALVQHLLHDSYPPAEVTWPIYSEGAR